MLDDVRPALLAYLPSPSRGVWHWGPIPIRAYAVCIIAGVIVAMIITERRWVARGGRKGTVADVATWVVPAGLVGARLYNLITDPELYFFKGKDPWKAFAIWDGGLGIWGAVLAGALVALWYCRRRGLAFGAFADATAPGLIVAQAIGRWGNYFNQELFGGQTSLPWGIRIDPAHRPLNTPNAVFYQPTFLYESIWDLATFGVLLWADRKWKLGHGRLFALYVACYTAGRAWIEALRVDHANHFLGVRINDWVCLVCFIGAVIYLYRTRGKTREEFVEPPDPGPLSDERALLVGGVQSASAGSASPRVPGPATGPPPRGDP
jgi:prolipoprotein diacylglyceryl transferase